MLKHPERKMRRSIVDHRCHPDFKCHLLRIRDERHGKITLSAKRHAAPGGSMQDKKEIEVIVSDFQKTIDTLEQVNLIPDKYQENIREDWELDGAEIALDSWPGLEDHIEIEGESEELVRQVSEKLGFDWEKRILHSRVELYGKIYGIRDNNKVHKLMEHLTFYNNPFANLISPTFK